MFKAKVIYTQRRLFLVKPSHGCHLHFLNIVELGAYSQAFFSTSIVTLHSNGPETAPFP